MTSSSGSRKRSNGRWRGAVVLLTAAGAALGGLAGCEDVVVPVPEPLPPNIEIAAYPPAGTTVRVEDAARIRLDFSRSMDRESLRAVRRVSFLMPVSAENLAGRWSDNDRHLEFDLTRFPLQRGATYQVVFVGLRAADGELYNRGPYKILFRIAGEPDLLPMQPSSRIATRLFCHRIGASDDGCSIASSQRAWSSGTDTLTLERRCDECREPVRRDLFRRDVNRIVWLGFDLELAAPAPVSQVRWPHPPAFVAFPLRSGQVLTAPDQSAPGGTGLRDWTATDSGKESPVYTFSGFGAPVQIVFDDCRVIALDYTLTDATSTERHRERWWLYPGVGLVRRETRIERGGEESVELETYTPSISDFD